MIVAYVNILYVFSLNCACVHFYMSFFTLMFHWYVTVLLLLVVCYYLFEDVVGNNCSWCLMFIFFLKENLMFTCFKI